MNEHICNEVCIFCTVNIIKYYVSFPKYFNHFIQIISTNACYRKLFWIEYSEGNSDLKVIKSSDTFGTSSTVVYESQHIQHGSPLELDLIYKSINFYQRNQSRCQQWELNYAGMEPKVELFDVEQPPVTSLSQTMHGFYYANREGLFSASWMKKQFVLVYGEFSDDFDILTPHFQLIDDGLVSCLRDITVTTGL